MPMELFARGIVGFALLANGFMLGLSLSRRNCNHNAAVLAAVGLWWVCWGCSRWPIHRASCVCCIPPATLG
jgi:type IV secretory pathway protease TraF